MAAREELEKKYLTEARGFAGDYVESTSPRELLSHMEIYQLVFLLFLGMTLISLFKALAAGFEIAAAVASLTQLLCLVLSLRYSSHNRSGRNILVFLLVIVLISSVLFFIGDEARGNLEQYFVFNPYLYATFYGFTIFFFKLLVERRVEYELFLELLKKSSGMGKKDGFTVAKEGILSFIDRLLMP
ncbi:TPA: hypothetical protein HA225_02530 [Candidatus Micrarchaeota archaeon]|nr:hypothetical protein [Candidatus Micrarchaeota archaeon]HIH30513.1 hypothetical protein [Candidatus Micrarchaeota archaeon]